MTEQERIEKAARAICEDRGEDWNRMSRRAFVASALALVAAPAIVRASSLMPIKMIEPTTSLLTGVYFSPDVIGRKFTILGSPDQVWRITNIVDDCRSAEAILEITR
jgi:hypothetical protein